MTSDTVTMRGARLSDTDRASGVLAAAFMDNPLTGWAVPDPDERYAVLGRFFRVMFADALERGSALVTPDVAAVALWYDHMQGPKAAPEGLGERIAQACGPWAERFAVIDERFARLHPAIAHWYLAFLAVDPARQNQRLGSQLLGFQHRWLEGRGMAAYLEASSEHNRRLYLRAGYVSGPEHRLPGDGPAFWPMWRPGT